MLSSTGLGMVSTGSDQEYQATPGAEPDDAQQPQDGVGDHDRRRPCG